MLKQFIFGLIVGVYWVNCCQRVPVGAGQVYSNRKTSGDGGFRLQFSENLDGYVPGTPYTVSLSSVPTSNRKFTRFMVTAEPKIPPQRGNDEDDDNFIPPNRNGIFQLFGDSLTQFYEDCVNTVAEKSQLPKNTVEFMWTAPPAGSGCILIKAMVMESRHRWYADDGKLTLEVCEKVDKPSVDDCCACDDAKYNVIFEGLWSNVTHPKDFPISLWLTHFSDVIGVSHERGFSFWGEGHIATDGFRLLAEWGSIRGLEQELKLKAKHLRTIFKSAGLWYPKVNTNTTGHFKVDRKRPLLSLVSMFGPSPDWVVGLNGYDLCLKDCTWMENSIIDLYPWDAGTDSGIGYESANSETKPRERMYRITTKYPEDPRAPFYNPNSDEMAPLARLYITREKIIPKSCDDKFLTSQIELSENVEETVRPECAVTDWSPWNTCSVTCGKGLRMRTREYVMPAKAQMFQCTRQLVSKEMCVADVPECQGGSGVSDSLSEEQSGDIIETRPEGICSVTVWGEWSPCSVSCGKGVKMRRRHFLDRMGPKKCFDVPLVEKEPCMVNTECRGAEQEQIDPNCPVTEWTDWSPCTKTCGGNGQTTRTRFLLVADSNQYCASKIKLSETTSCGKALCPLLNQLSAKEICMKPVEKGPCPSLLDRWYFEPKKLMCLPFKYGGCRGNENNFLTADDCNNLCQNLRNSLTPDTPIDCELSEWNSSQCSTSCGPGVMYQRRYVVRQPQNGGRPCSTRLTRKRRCQLRTCLQQI